MSTIPVIVWLLLPGIRVPLTSYSKYIPLWVRKCQKAYEGFLNWKMVSPWFPHSYVFVLNSWEPRPANHSFHRFLRWEPFSVPIWVGDRNGRAASHPCKCGRNSQGPEKVAMEAEMPGQMEMEWDGNEAFVHIFLFLHSPSYLQASCWITIWYYMILLCICSKSCCCGSTWSSVKPGAMQQTNSIMDHHLGLSMMYS